MSRRPLTHAEATAERGLRHVSEFIPEHFRRAAEHARQVARAKGQSKFIHTKGVCRELVEGLK